MKSQELIALMQQPHLVDETAFNSLNEMVERFPYANVFQLLLAKGMHNSADLSLDDRIRKAAIITPDRGVLYDLIYAKKMQEIIDKVELSIQEDAVGNRKNSTETIEEGVKDGEEITAQEVTQEEVLPLIEKEEVVPEEKDHLQQDILLEAINTTIQLDVDELLKEDRFNEVSAHDEVVKEAEPAETAEAFSTPLRFSDWLVSMKTIDEKVEEKEIPKQLNSSKDLIDRFISTKSKKLDVSKEPLTAQELGRMSLVENEDFVTETLAGIYAKQGKYNKAIKIYQQLILNFPEKSTFFASRIRFLKEKMEYDKN